MTTYEEQVDQQLGAMFEFLSQAIDGMEKRNPVDLSIGAANLLLGARVLVNTLLEAGEATDLGFPEAGVPAFFESAV